MKNAQVMIRVLNKLSFLHQLDFLSINFDFEASVGQF